MKYFVLLALSALAGSAQTPPPAASSFTGVVINQATGVPVAKAQVSLTPAAGGDAQGPRPVAPDRAEPLRIAGTLSGDDGRFRLDGVAPGVYIVRVRKSGFYPASSAPVPVRSGSIIAPLALRMNPQNVASGAVRDEDGEPVEGAFVQLLQRRLQRGGNWSVVSSATTDDQGAYRLITPMTGEFYVAAQPTRPVTPTSAPGALYITTFYPSALAVTEAKPIALEPGSHVTGVDLKLRSGRVFTIRGRALDTEGKPLKQTSLQILAPDQPPVGSLASSRYNSDDGAFEFVNVTSGKYRLVALAFQENTQSYAAADVTVRDADVNGVTLRIEPPVTVSGIVDIPLPPMPAGGPADIVPTEGIEARPQIRVGLNPAIWDGFSRSYTAEVNDDGTFRIDGVQPGAYEVAAGFQYGAYLSSVEVDGRDVLGKPLEIKSNLDKLVITYKADGGSVRAMLKGARPSGVRPPIIAIVPVDPAQRRAPFLYVFQMSSGREVTIPRIRPAEYYVWIFDRFGSYEQLGDNAFIGKIQAAATRVRVEPDGDHAIDVPLTAWP